MEENNDLTMKELKEEHDEIMTRFHETYNYAVKVKDNFLAANFEDIDEEMFEEYKWARDMMNEFKEWMYEIRTLRLKEQADKLDELKEKHKNPS